MEKPQKKTDVWDKGFTLIEVVMVIMLLGIIGSTAAMIIYQGARSYGEEEIRKDLTTQGRLAIERMAREIRLVRCTTAGNNCNPNAGDIPSLISATGFRFVNINYEGKGFTTSAGNLNLCRDSACASSDVLANNVSSLGFSYFKKDGTVAAAVGDIWTIIATLTLTRDNQNVNFRISVHPRRFK